MRAHASQMAPDHFLLTMPEPMFAMGMGVEFYIVESAPTGGGGARSCSRSCSPRCDECVPGRAFDGE